jgi:hypothetical protein
MATAIRAAVEDADDPSNPVAAFQLVSADGRLDRLLRLSESRTPDFRATRTTPRGDTLNIDLQALITDWLQGQELEQLGQRHLSGVVDESFRYEQLSEFVAQTLEHLLPWLLNSLVGWVNVGLEESDCLCSELAAYIRYGVDNAVSLEMAYSGVRSRRLISSVAARVRETELTTREFLAASDVRTWASLFTASPSELADLLFYTRARDTRITARVLAGEVVEIPIMGGAAGESGPVTVRRADEDEPQRLTVVRASAVVGFIRSEHHDDVARLLAIGLPLTLVKNSDVTLTLRLNDPADRATPLF